MKNIFMVAICIVAISCSHTVMPSTTPYANATIKNESGDSVLAGHCSLSMLEQEPYKEWFNKSYDAYNPDTAITAQLKALLQSSTIEIFLGSWCGDSKREVPRMLKILQTADFDTTKLKLIFVDNSTATYKQSPQHEEFGKNIYHVPTIIVYNKNKEIGRIIETPIVSLEKDLYTILQHKPYTPQYKSIVYWQQHTNSKNKNLSNDELKIIASKIKPLCTGMRDFNAYGYVLLAQKNFTQALNVFQLNILLYPENGGTFDSLGEAYYTMGDKINAKKNYETALFLKPGDENILKMLKLLE